MELLKAVRLEDKADAYARTLSGGMKRRLLVAKAMVHTPPVIVLDEPTAGVDIELQYSEVLRVSAGLDDDRVAFASGRSQLGVGVAADDDVDPRHAFTEHAVDGGALVRDDHHDIGAPT